MRHFVAFIGVLGCFLCAAGSLGVSYVGSRIDRARERIFERVDESLSKINGRLDETQELVEKSKFTVNEFQQRLRDWTKDEASERLVARFDLEQRAQQLSAGLQRGELVLELSREAVEQVRQALDMAADLGLSLNTDSVNALLERITDIRETLGQATNMAESLLQHIRNGGHEMSSERQDQVATIAVRLLVNFGNIDSWLVNSRDRLAEARAEIKHLNVKTHAGIVAATVCATLLMLWMGAGQFCLWRLARNR